MEISVSSRDVSKTRTGLLTVHMSREMVKKVKSRKIRPITKEVFDVIKSGDFDGDFEKTVLVHTRHPAKRILLIGLGKERKIDTEKIRRSCSFITAEVKDLKLERFSVLSKGIGSVSETDFSAAVVEGILLSDYSFNKYKLEERKKEKEIKQVEIICQAGRKQKVEEAVKKAKIVSDNVNLLRDWVNEGGDELNPEKITGIARKIAKKHRMKIRVFDEKKLRKMDMNLILGVGRGSRFPPRLVVMEYRGGNGNKIALVGKGVTFDSGGLDLKPPKYIENMKMDKAGALTVLAVMKTAAELGLKANLVGLMPLVENMIGPGAYKPGGVLKSYSGKTVEVEDTDAEGRLILADTLSYAEKEFKPKLVVDFATLTGVVLIVFGEYVAALVSTDKKLSRGLFAAGQKTYERVWELPLYEEYLEEMKGEIADVRNLGYKKGIYAGTITAGAFLKKFIGKTPWAHIDIAGTAWYEKPRYYIPKGGTGFGLRLMVEFLERFRG
jgi:leucyl aminopeptidase